MKIPFSQSLSNITFIFDLEENCFIYVHVSLSHFLKEKDQLSDIFPFIHPEDQAEVCKQCKEFLNGNLNGSCQFRVHLKGEERWFEVTPFLIALSSERLIFANAIDVTAERQNMYSIEKYANKKNSILHMLSHELKGPLNLARNLSTDLQSKLSKRSVMVRYVNLISQFVSQSVNIIEDFTSREFLDTVNISLVKKRLNIVQKVKEYMDELTRSEFAVQRTFNFESSHKKIYIQLDEAKFMQVINNLVSNALKFTWPGGSISVYIQDAGNTVILSFSDNGIGIPKKLQPFIFDEFTNARRRGLRGEATMGLGLSIVKSILKWHNGKISVYSRENEGTTFKIELPKG
ncbi:MAG TPA: PAS domain-containing sensor histidine kinase [Bacteroidia bacterium]|jgi:two-component system sensor histidine kinase VicK|nr:PAS domain-containing sensor histidine kinase [Bacteroidia bacterium]